MPYRLYKAIPPECRVYGAPYSIGTSRVLMTLMEKDIDCELRLFDTASRQIRILDKEHKESRYFTMQPFGKTPLFKDNDVTMFESRAIIRYIAHKHDDHGPHLWGTTEKERTMVDQWLEVEAQNYNPAIAPVVFHLVFAPWFGKIGDIRVVNSSLERLEKVLDIYERQLMKTKYLAGDFFSLADLSHLPFTQFLVNNTGKGHIISKRPHVLAWWTDISTRPTWLKHLAKAFPHTYTDPNEYRDPWACSPTRG